MNSPSRHTCSQDAMDSFFGILDGSAKSVLPRSAAVFVRKEPLRVTRG